MVTRTKQVVVTVMSHDGENDSDVLAMIAASAALTISGLPFLGPIAAAKVAFENGAYVLNPTVSQLQDTQLELVVAGTTEGVMMVESEARELSEEIMLGAVEFGHKEMQPVIDLIISMAEDCAKEPREVAEPAPVVAVIQDKVAAHATDAIAAAYKLVDKSARRGALDVAKDAMMADLSADMGDDFDALVAGGAFKSLESDVVRGSILDTGMRIDGRDTKTVRQIIGEVGILPRTHGSALFTRGETQALVTATLGTGQDEQIVDGLVGEYRERFMLHYNFPPYSVGEAGRMGSPGRREIGHGKLAWRALKPVMPNADDFPYVVRVVSEITESNGSSSMATVCGGSLAMMDAGVPLPHPVAGIAMGLIKEGERFAVLSDILVMKIIWATWTSKWLVPLMVSQACRWTLRSPALPQTSCRLRWIKRKTVVFIFWVKWIRR